MTQSRPQQKPSFIETLLEPVAGTAQLRAEKARLEAFLAAVPGEYCGFAPDGAAVFSDGFAALLGLSKIGGITDIQGALATSDAAALEGQFTALQELGRGFSLIVRAASGQSLFRLTGTKGHALSGTDRFEILWLEDITHQQRAQKELESSRDAAQRETRRLQSALDTLPHMVWIRGADTALEWCNTAYAAAMGLTPAAVIAEQKNIAIARSKGQGPDSPGLARAALDTGQPQGMSVHVILGGKRRFMRITETPLPASAQTLGTAQDITREEELEKDMQRHAGAHKELLEQLRTAIGIFAPDHRLEFFNTAFSQLWGLEDAWLNTRPRLSEIMEKLREKRRLPEQADFRTFKDSWIRMFTGLIDPHEDMLYLPDNTALRMLAVPNPMGGLIMTFEDVTSRLALESSYNTLIAVQKETLDNLAEAVVVYGTDGRIKLWNPAFAEMWDFTPQQLETQPHINDTSRSMENFFEEGERSTMRSMLIAQALERSMKDGRLALKDGRLIEHTTVPLPDGGVLISYADITDSSRVEKALREKNAALETAERLKLDFLANVSYQLRTPLNAITGFNQILDNQYFGTLNDKQREYTKGIAEAGERLATLISDILDLSSIEAGYMEMDYAAFDVRSMMDAIFNLTREWAGGQKLKVLMDCPKDIGTLNADERRLKQVLINLIRNAIHFTPAEGTITLKAHKGAGAITFTVGDTGVGIPKEDQGRIFEPFERLQVNEQAATGQRGAGLGLALVRNIVQMHGGTIAIDSDRGKGTAISITIPLQA